MLETIHELDVYLLQLFNNWGTKSLDPFWLFVTKIYVWIPILLPLFYLAIKNQTRENKIKLFMGLIFLLLIVLSSTELVKIIVARLRPCNNELLEGTFRELIHPNSYSFYSGHTASSVSIVVFCISLLKKQTNWIWLLVLWAILFSYSRLYLAVHYPSDIFVGGIVGFTLAKATIYFMKKRQFLSV